MRIVAAGVSGLLGEPLVRRWRAAGHEVVRLVRRAPTAPGEVAWDPSAGELDPRSLGRVDAAVCLSGANVGGHRWTEGYRRTILESRTSSTATLARALAALDEPPSVLLQASASGYYGDRGDLLLDESSGPGSAFLADVCVAWEAAAEPARAAGVRVVALRTGLVMAPDGGATGPLLPLLRLGLGGPLGSGREWWSWVSAQDEVRAIDFLLTADVAGPVNLVAPEPARNADVVRALARALHRPALLPVPRVALQVAVGGLAEEVLSSRRVRPTALLDAGFTWDHPDLASAARWVTAG